MSRSASPGSDPAVGMASVTGLLSGGASSGVVATAEPIRDAAGQVPAAYGAGWQAVASRLTLRPTAGGSATSARAVAAWPAGTVTTTRSGAAALSAVWPRAPMVALSLGLKASPAQSVA